MKIYRQSQHHDTRKLQSIAFKWFETFNNKELEKLYLYDDDAEHFSPKLKPTNQKQMAL
jgi:hypothetical protein